MTRQRAAPAAAVTRAFVLLLLVAGLEGCGGCGVRILPPKIAQGGRAMSIAVSPASDAKLLVAAETGGLFQSYNGGESWIHRSTLPSWLVSDVEFHPTDADLAIAVTREDFKADNGGGTWRSETGGEFWTQVTGVPVKRKRCPERLSAWAVSFDPDGEDVYVADDCGLAISRDRGSTWKRIQLDPARAVDLYRRQNRVWDVVALGGGRVNAAGADGIWTSADSGAHWTRSTSAPTAAQDGVVHALAVSPFDRDHLFLAAGGYHLFLSIDAGLTWTDLRAGDGGRPAFVRTSPANARRGEEFDVYFGGGVRIYRRTFRHGNPPEAQGADWTTLTVDHADPADIAFAGRTAAPLLLATDGGLHGTADGGATWTLQGAAYDGYNALQITEVIGQLVEGEEPHTDLYFGTQDNDVLASPDGGSTWPRRRCCEGFYLRTGRRSIDHEGAKVSGVTCGGCGHFLGEPHLATHGGFPSAADPDPTPGSRVAVNVPVPLQPGHYLQAVMFPDLFPGRWMFYLTQDGGENWDFRGDTFEQLMGRFLVGGPPSQPVLYVAVRRPGTTVQGYPKIGLLRIDNAYGPADLTFTAADGAGFGSQGTFPTMFAWYQVFGVDPEDPDHLLVADIEGGEMRVSWDRGANWAADAELTGLVTGGGEYVFSVDGFSRNGFLQAHVIEFDPENPCHLVVGTAENGILRSPDGGLSWGKVEDTELITNLSSIFFSGGRSLYVSSYGRSLWLVRVDRPAPVPTTPGPWRCPGREKPAGWPPEVAEPAPVVIDMATGERRPFAVLERTAECPECRWLTVAWGRFTEIAVEDGKVARLAVSGGVVRALPPAAEPSFSPPPLEVVAGPADFEGHESLVRLAGERLSVQAVQLDPAGRLRAVVAARQDLFTKGLTPPQVQIVNGDFTSGDPTVASGEPVEIVGRGFEPNGAVEIRVDGVRREVEVGTDKAGLLRATLPVDLPPGAYSIEVVQRLTDGLRAERTTLRVVVRDEPRVR